MPKKSQSRVATQELPELKEGIAICRVGITRGGSQFEVYDGESTWLAELPKRFRNTIWIRRGGFVLVDTSSAPSSVGGTRGEIIFALQKDDISELKKQGFWPSTLDEMQSTPVSDGNREARTNEATSRQPGDEDGDSSDSDLFQNNNRR